MLGALISQWTQRLHDLGSGDSFVLTERQFNREVTRERIRATRRSIPFCVITIQLQGNHRRRARVRTLLRLLHRDVRITDHKGLLGPGKYGVLLVDTPETGGRAALDRVVQLADQHALDIVADLRVHDPGGFDSDDDLPDNPQRRRADDPAEKLIRAQHDVQVSAEDPLIPRPMLKLAIKRGIDIGGAITGIIVTGPLMLASMAAIRWSDGGPAIFRQTREGHRGRPFTIFKLRTMVVDAEQLQAELQSESHRDGPAFKIAHDPRVTRLGHLLRRYCIDELPQFWNVLKGDMSLVGPRPLPWLESRACSHWQRRRLDVRPGLTCDWQINKADVGSFDEWMRLDLQYVDQIGLIRDLRLIARTVTVPMSGRGGE